MDHRTDHPPKSERLLKELTTLRQVSQAISSTLDLEAVLSSVQVELSKLMDVDNFYVALYDETNQRIWYPLAVKKGQRQTWSARPLSDRLTDRVIRRVKPLLLNLESSRRSIPIDLPPSDSLPTAWIGVPLVSPNRVVGCLALFSVSSGAEFSEDDLKVLTIVSGSISIAIENALLFEQVQRRAAQLQILNRIMALVSASLEPEEVLAQVCRSIPQLTDAGRSAIFLTATEGEQVRLAYSHELSAEFVDQNQSYAARTKGRTDCLRTGQPFLIADIQKTNLEKDFAESLKQAGILSYGDFPMSTPDGQIGFLSVYFDSPHQFQKEEIELLKTLASQAAVAVTNANLYARTDFALSRRVQQLAMLESVGRELSAATTSDKLFQTILEYAREYTQATWGIIELYEPETSKMIIKASVGYPGINESYPLELGISGRAVRTRQAINIGNVSLDPDFQDLTSGATRSQLSIPLLDDEQVLGVITLESHVPDGFSASDQAFVSHLANQAAIAIVNAQLFAEVSNGRDRLVAVLNSAKEGFLMIESGGRIMLANPAIRELTGTNPAELIDRRLTDLDEETLMRLGFKSGEAHELVDKLESGKSPTPSRSQVEIDESPTNYTDQLQPPGIRRARRFLQRASLPVWRRSAQMAGWMIVFRDVTQEYEIAEARKLITETLWHDLRSPISTVWSALGLLEEGLQAQANDPLEQIKLAQLARRSAKRVLDLAESLLDIESMQSGKVELNLSQLNLHDLTQEVLDDFYPQADEYGIELQVDFPGLPEISADPGKLGRVLFNLIDNALKFTPAGGKVQLSAQLVSEARVAVMVSDTGPGIPPEFRKKIFDRFTQVPGSTGRRRGTGLGLTFCRLAVEAHGGNIFVEPRPGGGSSFTFTLPIVQRVETEKS